MSRSRNVVVLVSLLAVSTAAHADPPEAMSPPTAELAVGVMVGYDSNTFGAITVEGTYRLVGGLWAHAMAGYGDTEWKSSVGDQALDGTYDGSYITARAGVEEHLCTISGLCAFGGLDLGFRRMHFNSADKSMGTSVVLPADASYDRAVAVPRIGLDYGSRHLRFRPDFELDVDTDGLRGFQFNLPVAYRW
jgi:hypothetical protein